MKKIFVLLTVLYIIEGSYLPYCLKKYDRYQNTITSSATHYANKVPYSFQKCKRDDINLSECLAQIANAVWPQFAKAHKFNKIPVITNKKIPNFINGSFNGHINGFEDLKFNDIFVDFNSQKVRVIYSQPVLTTWGRYLMTGRFLGFGINDYGDANMTYIKGTYDYDFQYDLEQRDGEEYIKLTTYGLDFNAEHLISDFTSVEHAERGHYINWLFNNNWGILNMLVENTFSEIFSDFYSPIIREHLNKYPLSSIFD